MSFEKALTLLKKGSKISRKGWNGKEQYLILGTGIEYSTTDGRFSSENAIVFVGSQSIQVGWLASQADMLANDWIER